MRKLYSIRGNRKAFTIVEVLVTLALIGIISSLTIVPMIKNYQQKQFHASFKKNYSILSQAFIMLKADYGGTLAYMYPGCNGNWCSNNGLGQDLMKYLKYVKWCRQSYAIADGCMYENGPKWLNESEHMWDYRINNGAFILNNGAVFFYNIPYYYNDYISGERKVYTYAQMYIDVNGFKGPNIMGKDVYGMHMNADGLLPFGTTGTEMFENGLCTIGNNDATNLGLSCAVKVLQNIDY